MTWAPVHDALPLSFEYKSSSRPPCISLHFHISSLALWYFSSFLHSLLLLEPRHISRKLTQVVLAHQFPIHCSILLHVKRVECRYQLVL
jgi:hypothetical protein